MKLYTLLFAVISILTFSAHSFAQTPDVAAKKTDKKPITNCGTPGDVCSDGTLLIGLYCPDEEKNLNSCVLLYAPPYDQANLITWHGSVKKDHIRNDSESDGSTNQGQANPIAEFPAMQACANLNYSGYSDWYLPSQKELLEMFMNHRNLRNFKQQSYWSSTEDSNSQAWTQNFTDGAQKRQAKNGKMYVRCVRRGKFQ